MNMINVTLVGNLVKDPEQFTFASGRTKTTMRIAVSNPARQQKEQNDEAPESASDFYRIEVWGKLAELAFKYLQKGQQVGVSGRLIMERWTDKEGRERLTPVVAATQLQFPPRTGAAKAVSYPQVDVTPDQRATPIADESSDEAFHNEMARNDLFTDARVLSIKEQPQPYSPFRPPERKRA